MGNSSSSSTDYRFTSATRAFSPHELEELKSLYGSLAAQSQSNAQFISLPIFKCYFKIPGSLGDRMFDLVTQNRHDQKLTFEDLVIAKGTYEKGTRVDIEEFIYQLLDITGDGKVSRSDVQAILDAILDDLFPTKDPNSGLSSHQSVLEEILSAALFSKDDEASDGKCMSFEDFKDLCNHIPSLRKYLGSLLMPPDPGRPGCQVPHLLYSESYGSNIILRHEYAWLIGGHLTQPELEEWKLLYHSSYHGLSFSTFLGVNISHVITCMGMASHENGWKWSNLLLSLLVLEEGTIRRSSLKGTIPKTARKMPAHMKLAKGTTYSPRKLMSNSIFRSLILVTHHVL